MSAKRPTELPNDGVRAETLAELAQLIQVDWFPGGPNSIPTAPVAPSQGHQSMVEAVQRMGMRARLGGPSLDRDAVLMLFIMTSACHIQMMSLTRERPGWVRQVFVRALCWPTTESPVGPIKSLFRNVARIVAAGRFVLECSSAKGNLKRTANSCAFQLLAYMVLARRGFICDARCTQWVTQCTSLDRLSEASWPAWWDLGQGIARDMFPDLDKLLFGSKARSAKCYYGDAIVELRRACENIWTVFLVVEGPG